MICFEKVWKNEQSTNEAGKKVEAHVAKSPGLSR